MAKKKPFSEVEKLFADKGYILLSKEENYKNTGTKLEYICPNHTDKGVLEMNTRNISQGKGCRFCGHESSSKKQNEDIKTVKKAFEKVGLILLEEKYRNSDQKLQCFCEYHPDKEIFKSYKVVKNGHGCEYCGFEKLRIINKKFSNESDFEVIKKEYLEKGFILEENNYTNNSTPMKCRCVNHPDEIQMVRYADLNRKRYGCKYCTYEKKSKSQRLPFDRVKETFEDRGFTIDEDEVYQNNTKPLKCFCHKHPDKPLFISYGNMSQGYHSCKYCWDERRRGETSPLWKNGITNISNYLRECITDWKINSIKNCDFKCVVTGGKFDVIHHLTPHSIIVREAHKNLGIEIRPIIGAYSNRELKSLIKETEVLHNKYGYGVCLKSSIHTLFHRTYGYKDNTPDQFYEFKEKYINGDYEEEHVV